MKKLSLFILTVVSCFSVFSQESINDSLIETNLTDNLKTRIRIKKSAKIDIEHLSRLSRITDMHKRNRLKMINPMTVTSMSVSEILDANPIYANDSTYVLTKRGIVNTLVSTNLYVNSLKPLTYLSISDKLSPTQLKTYQLIGGDVSSFDILKIDVNSIKMYDTTVFSNYDGIDMTIDQEVYAIDNSKFSVIITEEILAELARDTSIYSYEKSKEFNVAYYKDLQALDRETYYEWIKFLGQHLNSEIEFIKNTNRFKMIGEARIENDKYTDEDRKLLKSNLEVLKNEGYDTVLVRFYCDQDLTLITKMIHDIKSTGMKVFSVYVGLDNRKPCWNPYVKPELIEKYIGEVAPLSEGWLLNWRSTSQHVKLLPKEFFNYISKTVRKYNKTCLIYGEIYYGQIDPLRTTALMYNIPENATGVVINNMGFSGYNHQFVANKMFAKIVPNYKNLDRMAQVIGYRPYYSSKNNLYFDTKEEYSYKHKIENNFRKARCGTITMLHDGVDDNYAEDYTTWQSQDNIMKDHKIHALIDVRQM